MATRLLIRGGKILTIGVDYEEVSTDKLRVMKWGYVGDVYTCVDVAAGTIKELVLDTRTGGGKAGDRVDKADAIQWDVSRP